MKNEMKRGVLVGCAGIGLLALALAASPARAADPAPASPETVRKEGEIVHMSATVASIDKGARKLTLKKPDGDKVSIKAPSDLKAFDKLKVGDKIDVDYMESIAVGFLPPGSKPKITEREAAIPGAAGRELSMSAEVVSVDAASNKVTLKGPRGVVSTVSVQDPQLQAKLPDLKPGQVVVLQYTEAVATAIQPPAK